MLQTTLIPSILASGADIHLIEQLCEKIALGERAMEILDHGPEDEAMRDVLESELREALTILRRMTAGLPQASDPCTDPPDLPTLQ